MTRINPWDQVFNTPEPTIVTPRAVLLKFAEDFKRSEHRNPGLVVCWTVVCDTTKTLLFKPDRLCC